MQQAKARPSVTLITGKSGSGKTSFALRYLVNAGDCQRFIFDPYGDIAERLSYPAASTVHHLAKQATEAWTIFDPSTMFPGDGAKGLEFLCEFVLAIGKRNAAQRKILFVDELQKWVPTAKLSPSLAEIAEGGRKWGVEMVMVTHRPNTLPGGLMQQVTEIVAFQTLYKRALQRLEEYDLDPAELQRLPALHYVAVNCETFGQARGKIRF